MKKHNWTGSDIKSQKGKIVLITGANSGIGFEAARTLSEKGATVIMAVRDLKKGQTALDQIKVQIPAADTELMQLDLADLESVRKFSDEYHSRYSSLDVLINNAGVMYPPKRESTRDGFELQFGINHLGHFALTGLLLDIIKRTAFSRVVTQSSIAHKYMADIYFKDLNWEKNYNKTKAYAQSKLANLLFTYELDRKFKENGIKSLALACHPGISNTNLFRSSGFGSRFSKLIGQEAIMGALPVIRASTEEGLSGAEYFGPTEMMEIRGYPELVSSSKKSYDKDLAKDLWTVSEKLTGIIYKFS
jgi:NAD(P)-dependent dehydrogenase (short-subunit alcohol dehydrogenase family)